MGNRISETDANGNTTSYVYDLLDRLEQETDAENQVTGYEYDAVGNLIRLTNPRGFSTDFAYDGDDLLVSITDALSQVWQFEYDAAHNRTDVVDPHGVVTHSEFDGLNRLTDEIRNYVPAALPDFETNVTTSYTLLPGQPARLHDRSQRQPDGLSLRRRASADGARRRSERRHELHLRRRGQSPDHDRCQRPYDQTTFMTNSTA